MIANFTSISTEFQSFAQDFGKPVKVDPTVYEKYFSGSINHIKRYSILSGVNSFGQKLDIEVGLVENKKVPNAYCAFHEGKHFILIEHLFPIALLEFFHRLLANPAVLPGIGNTRLDTSLKRAAENNFLPGFEILSGTRPLKNLDEIENIYGALCPERRKAAMLLYEHAMTFLYSHELAHSLLGHVLYVRHQMGIKTIEETVTNFDEEIQRKIYCFLEEKADMGATWNTVGRVIYNVNDTRPKEDRVADATFRILGSSLLLYFFALTDLNLSNGDGQSIYQWYDHPSSAARAITVTLLPMVQSPGYDRYSDAIIKEASLTTRVELLRIASTLEYFKPYNWLRINELSELTDNYNQLSDQEREEVTNDLKNYAFGHLY